MDYLKIAAFPPVDLLFFTGKINFPFYSVYNNASGKRKN